MEPRRPQHGATGVLGHERSRNEGIDRRAAQRHGRCFRQLARKAAQGLPVSGQTSGQPGAKIQLASASTGRQPSRGGAATVEVRRDRARRPEVVRGTYPGAAPEESEAGSEVIASVEEQAVIGAGNAAEPGDCNFTRSPRRPPHPARTLT